MHLLQVKSDGMLLHGCVKLEPSCDEGWEQAGDHASKCRCRRRTSCRHRWLLNHAGWQQLHTKEKEQPPQENAKGRSDGEEQKREREREKRWRGSGREWETGGVSRKVEAGAVRRSMLWIMLHLSPPPWFFVHVNEPQDRVPPLSLGVQSTLN